MQELEAIEVTISGITAAFRVPLAATGVIPSVPVPTYPHLLGFVACCMGTYYPPAKIRFGFEFNVSGTGHDLEKIWRWDFKQGKPKRDDVTAIRKKEFLLDPELKLYVINDLQGIDLEKVFKCPVGVPTLGQSQDVVMITDVKKNQNGEKRIRSNWCNIITIRLYNEPNAFRKNFHTTHILRISKTERWTKSPEKYQIIYRNKQ